MGDISVDGFCNDHFMNSCLAMLASDRVDSMFPASLLNMRYIVRSEDVRTSQWTEEVREEAKEQRGGHGSLVP